VATKSAHVLESGGVVHLVVQRVYLDGHKGPYVRMTALAGTITEDVTGSLLPPVWKESYLPKEGEILQSPVKEVRRVKVRRQYAPQSQFNDSHSCDPADSQDEKVNLAWRAYDLRPITPEVGVAVESRNTLGNASSNEEVHDTQGNQVPTQSQQ